MEVENAMVRIPPAMLVQLDELQAEAQADPELCALLASQSGTISRSALVRLCLSRGMASVRGALRARAPEEARPAAKVKPATKKKPAKKAAKRRR